MRLRFIIVGLVASGVACSGGTLGSGGTGGDGSGGSVGTGSGSGVGTGVAGIGDDPGTAGSVGVAGSLGTAGSAGDSGGSAGTGGSVGAGGSSLGGTGGTFITGIGGRPMLPACTDTGTDSGGASILGPDGMLVTAQVTAAVTVASIDGCAAEPCPRPASKTRKIVLASADQTQWTLSLGNSVMPPDLIQVGDAFDLTVDGGVDTTFYSTISQVVVLSRAGKLVAFGSSTNQFYHLGLPNLAAFGINIADGGAICGRPNDAGCIPETHALVVTVDGSSVTVMPGHAATIGWLSFAPGNTTVLVDSGSCDAKSTTGMAGFRLP